MEKDVLSDKLKTYLESAPLSQELKEKLEAEDVRFKKFSLEHKEERSQLESRYDSFVYQIITFEAGILGAIVIFTDSKDTSSWIAAAIISLLTSIAFGIWWQNRKIKSAYNSHDLTYDITLRMHILKRKAMGDDFANIEEYVLNLPSEDLLLNQKSKLSLQINPKYIDFAFKAFFFLSLVLLSVHVIRDVKF